MSSKEIGALLMIEVLENSEKVQKMNENLRQKMIEIEGTFQETSAVQMNKIEQMKEESLKKLEKSYLEPMLQCEKYNTITQKIVKQVARKLRAINRKSNQLKEIKN